jgi:hypothetical protein
MLTEDIPTVLKALCRGNADELKQNPEWLEALGRLVEIIDWTPPLDKLRCERPSEELGTWLGDDPYDHGFCDHKDEIANDMVGRRVRDIDPILRETLNATLGQENATLQALLVTALSNSRLALRYCENFNLPQDCIVSSLRCAFVDEVIGYANMEHKGWLLGCGLLEHLWQSDYRELVHQAMLERSCKSRDFTYEFDPIGCDREELYRGDGRLYKNTGGISGHLPWHAKRGERHIKYALVGSMIPYSFIPMKREYDDEYVGADIDIAVETGDADEETSAADVAHVAGAIIVCLLRAWGADKEPRYRLRDWQLAPGEKRHWLFLEHILNNGNWVACRKIEVFGVPSIVGAVRAFHLNCVRAFYGEGGLKALPSFLAAYVCRVNDRPRNLPRAEEVRTPMQKYQERGFIQIPKDVVVAAPAKSLTERLDTELSAAETFVEIVNRLDLAAISDDFVRVAPVGNWEE